VKRGGGAGLHANDITEQPKEQVDGVHALIDQGAAAIERQCAAPARIGVVLGGAIPLHAGIHEQRFAEQALIHPVFELANVRLDAVLENHAELDFRLSCGFDEGIGAYGADFDRLLREHVQAAAGGGDTLLRVQAGRATDDYQVHGAMWQEDVEVSIGGAAVFAAEAGDFFCVGSMDRGDFYSREGPGGASVRFRDVAAANEADVEGHEKCSVIRKSHVRNEK